MRAWLLAPAFLTACTSFDGRSDVIITSTPPGAEILLDGEATGKHTPARLELGGYFAGDHRITLRRRGYQDEDRVVYHYSQHGTSRWVDGATDPGVWVLPIFWTIEDFLTPFKVHWDFVPHELYVRLYPSGQAPVNAAAPDTVGVPTAPEAAPPDQNPPSRNQNPSPDS